MAVIFHSEIKCNKFINIKKMRVKMKVFVQCDKNGLPLDYDFLMLTQALRKWGLK